MRILMIVAFVIGCAAPARAVKPVGGTVKVFFDDRTPYTTTVKDIRLW